MLIMVMGLSFSAQAQGPVVPCNGETRSIGSEEYLIQIPTQCDGAWLIYCGYWKARILLMLPNAQCISLICPDESSGGGLQF